MLLGATALILGGVILLPQTVLAYKGDPNAQGPNYTPERHEAMIKAFENKDYQAWQELMSGRGITQRINEQNFAQFAEAHQLAQQGNVEEAQKIRAELGLNQQNGTGAGQGQGMKHGRMNR